MCRLEEAIEDADWQYWLVESVSRASVVVADVTDHNAFVMYELGVAHQQGIPAVLTVNSRNERVPATVRGTPFLPYAVDDLAQFEMSLAAVLRDAIEPLSGGGEEVASSSAQDDYLLGLQLLQSFRVDAGIDLQPVSRDEFSTRMRVAQHRGDWLPDTRYKRHAARHLLAKIISDSDRIQVMQTVEEWLQSTYVTQ
jgi:hypothetical protein